MNHTTTRSITLAALILSAACPAAVAQTLPDPKIQVSATAQHFFASHEGGYVSQTLETFDPGNTDLVTVNAEVSAADTFFGPWPPAVATASLSLAPIPLLTSTAASQTLYFGEQGWANRSSAHSSAQIDYYFDIVGPDLPLGALVPVTLVASSFTSFSFDGPNATATVLASLILDGYEGFYVQAFKGTGLGGLASEDFSIATTIWLTPNENHTLGLETYAATVGAATASAILDPYLFIDPTFENASLYSIVVSPGVGNVPASSVPEPANTAALFAAALGLLAFARTHPSLMKFHCLSSLLRPMPSA